MDPVTLAAGAVVLLKPFLAKSYEEFAGQAGAAAWRLAERLFARLRDAASHDHAARRSLDDLGDAPERAEEAIGGLLERDPALAKEVGDLIAQVKQLGPTVVITQRIEEAEEAVGVRAKRVRAGRVEVTQDVKKANSIVGADLDEIG